MLNKAILMGRLTADPELRQTANGTAVCSFCIAVDRNYSRDQEKQTDFISIVAWKNTAEFVSKYFSKGSMIIVDGSIQVSSYLDKHDCKRTVVEVVAGSVMFGESKKAAEQGGQAPPASGGSVSHACGADFEEAPPYSEDLPF